MNETNCSKFKKRAAALAVASCLTLAPWLANAAGLGKITVLSGLGQPLRAELEVSANRDELAGMTARLAPQEVFRQAGVDYSSVLLDLRFAIEKRASGQTVVKITSGKPVNEPFLDFLVELNWPAGRLVREYTFLLDPPEVAVKQAARAVVDARVVETVPGGGTQSAPATRPAPAQRVEPAPRPDAGDTRVVRAGENLRKIATETQHDGVSLEQMLVGIFRKNPDAFVGNNMNRLKAGAILGLPDKETVASIPEGEAKRVFLAQSSDWNSYRQKLAAATSAAPAQEGVGSQTSSGQITARVQEKLVPAEQSKDQVKVARTDVSAPGSAGVGSAEAEADRIARDKALREAQDRLAMLEKNVAELQKLVELKNLQLAELQQQAANKGAAKPVEPAKPEAAVKPVEPPPAVAAAAPEATKAAEEPAVKPAEPPKVEAPKPVEPPKPAAPVTPPAPPPELESEPGLLDAIFGDPLPLAGGAGILALLAGYFVYRRRRSDTGATETTTAPGPSSLGPNSVFRMTGGQSVDTGNTPPQTGDFSQTGPGTIDTDEVDPVAEADVYMAYGRDSQAEEILLEALQKDPQRTAIHAKLLEIYANRRSVKQFETLASELYAQTGGVGAEWEKVAALGVGLDPQNPLYSGVAVKSPAFDSDATMVVSPGDVGKATLALAAGALAQMAAAEPVKEPNGTEDSALTEELERDTLVLGEPEAPAAPSAESAHEEVFAESEPELGGLDFDLAVAPEAVEPEQNASLDSVFAEMELAPAAADNDALDFDISGDVPLSAAATTLGNVGLSAGGAVEVKTAGDFTLPGTSADAPYVDDLGHDFSPEGTLLMPVPSDDDIDLHMEAAASTFVGEERQPEQALEEEAPVVPMVDFDLDVDQAGTATVVNSLEESLGSEPLLDNPSSEPVVDVEVDNLSFDELPPADEQKLAQTLFNPATATDLEFDVNLTDSVFLGQPMVSSDFDMGSINLDLGAEPSTASAAEEAVSESGIEQPLEHDAQWEEVNTKLDLAKAYEEMGDLEGARELLQEVVGEGSADLVEQAQAILARIGE